MSAEAERDVEAGRIPSGLTAAEAVERADQIALDRALAVLLGDGAADRRLSLAVQAALAAPSSTRLRRQVARSTWARPRRWLWAMAALVAVLITAAVVAWSPADGPIGPDGRRLTDRDTIHATVPTQVRWPDGSELTLAAGGVLSGQGPTLVGGSATIAVMPQHGRTFAIATPHARVEVIGTAFRLAVDAQGSLVAVDHGRVRVRVGTAMIDLVAGESARVTADGRRRHRVLEAAPGHLPSGLVLAAGSVTDGARPVWRDGPLAGAVPPVSEIRLAREGGPVAKLRPDDRLVMELRCLPGTRALTLWAWEADRRVAVRHDLTVDTGWQRIDLAWNALRDANGPAQGGAIDNLILIPDGGGIEVANVVLDRPW
jgi:hypothetical protein